MEKYTDANVSPLLQVSKNNLSALFLNVTVENIKENQHQSENILCSQSEIAMFTFGGFHFLILQVFFSL